MHLNVRLGALLLSLVVLWGAAAGAGYGQSPLDNRYPAVDRQVYDLIYRPPAAEYRIQRGERFDLIYQVGAEDMARRTLVALDAAWPATDSLVGPVSANFHTPVVINRYGDVGNGYVEPFPFRQEIESVSNKQDPLVARASTWPALVAPHELMHSAHLDANAGVGIGGVVRAFAPDWARALNGTAPRGLLEGAAVYRESHLEPGAGRLHAPLFTMKMKAAMLSEEPWDLAQMLEASAYTQPFNRSYIAGGHAFSYLAHRGDSTDTGFFTDVVTWHNRFPFLGFGAWLWASTDQFPYELSDEIQTQLRSQYSEELDRRRPFTPTSLVAGEEGVNHRRPYWLDDSTLVAYVTGYDVRAGFYRIDAASGERQTIRVQTLTEDRSYSLSADTSALYASRHVSDPLVPTQEIAEVERVGLSEGTAMQLTSRGRALAPAEGPSGTVHAVTNDGPFTRWSVVEEEGSTQPLTPKAPMSIRQIAPSPDGDRVAVLVNVEGKQKIYRTSVPVDESVQLEPWIGLDDSIVYDLSWGPDGQYLLFAADYPETANVFAFDTETEQVLQLANVPFGALEPALSPDRSTVAFVNYQHERHDLVTVRFRPDSARVVPASVVNTPDPLPPGAEREQAAEEIELDDAESYSAWRHLAPRMVYPSVHSATDYDPWGTHIRPPADLGVGVSLAGADPLKQWAYHASAYWQDGGLWGEAQVESSAVLLRPSLSVFDRTTRTSGLQPGVEERGIGVGVRLPITLESNVYQSLLRFGLETELRQIRLYGGGLAQPSPFSTRLTFQPQAVFGYRLQQNPRDLIPNTGMSVAMQGEFDSWVDAGALGIQPRNALYTDFNVYLPFLRQWHTGVRLGASLLTQNTSTFGTSTFAPRGYDHLRAIDGIARASGTFLRLDAEFIQPLWYIDEGWSLIPIYAKALSVYGFGQTVGRVSDGGWREAASAVGGGVSLRARFFYLFNFEVRFGAAFLPGPGDVKIISR